MFMFRRQPVWCILTQDSIIYRTQEFGFEQKASVINTNSPLLHYSLNEICNRKILVLTY